MKKKAQLKIVREINTRLLTLLNTKDMLKVGAWWTKSNTKMQPTPMVYAREKGLEKVLEMVREMKTY